MSHLFLTGATGFLGKVVLETLLRRRHELNVQSITVLVRPLGGESAWSRFEREVLLSPCFDGLTGDWRSLCRVVAGDLCRPDCGLTATDREHIVAEVTHVIHCAASVDFNLPVKEALAINTDGALSMLGLAKQITKLESMVSVSTAYVAAHRSKDVKISKEELVPLPLAADALHRAITNDEKSEADLLALTGHPNTYTLTKCLTEHMLNEAHGNVPLTIVRPSIISASWQHPVPGWIDSHAAYAGFVALIGLGWLRAIVADHRAALDVVPCDVVATRIVDAAFAPPKDRTRVAIKHAVAGIKNCSRNDMSIRVITDYFNDYRVGGRKPKIHHLADNNLAFWAHDRVQHDVPVLLARLVAQVSGNKKQARRAKKLREKLQQLNASFPPFTQHTFDFRSSEPFADPTFTPERYVTTICRGVQRHLLKQNEQEVLFGGRTHKEPLKVAWRCLTAPGPNAVLRVTAFLVDATLRLGAEAATFDRASFEAAMKDAPADALPVLLPSHRSYMDFVLCAYLCFARPELGLKIPHIAAAEEFSRIFILGKLLQKMQAFYLKRNVGKKDDALNRQVHALVEAGETLMFFIEGARSRTRRFLPPRRGLLRSLQASGQPCTVLPIAISYERVTEEKSFVAQLEGAPKPKMELRGLAAWSLKLLAGKVDIGRVHISCGKPLTLDEATDVHELSREVMGELQRGSVVTTHQLDLFLRHSGLAGQVTRERLTQMIVARGGQVVAGGLQRVDEVAPLVERTMRYQFLHLFYADALAVYGDNPAVQCHIANNRYDSTVLVDESILRPADVLAVTRALFAPICRDYSFVVDECGELYGDALADLSLPTLLKRHPSAFLADVETALEDLVAREILTLQDNRYGWGAKAHTIEALRLILDADGTLPVFEDHSDRSNAAVGDYQS